MPELAAIGLFLLGYAVGRLWRSNDEINGVIAKEPDEILDFPNYGEPENYLGSKVEHWDDFISRRGGI